MKTLKKVLCVVLSMAMILGMVAVSSASFATEDITYKEAVDVLTFAKVIDGFPDGTFRPTETLTRAQAAKIITYVLGYKTDVVPTTVKFTDVKGNWAEGFISVAADLGILDGFPNGAFKPNEKLTGYQWAKILLCGLGYSSKYEGLTGSGWSANVARLIKLEGMTKGIANFNGTKAVTREEACQMLFNVLGSPFVAYGADADEKAIAQGIYPASIPTSAKLTNFYWNGPNNFAAMLGLGLFDTTYDAFGRPSTKYTLGTGMSQTSLVIAKTPVAEYTSTPTLATIYKDLGVKYDANYTAKYRVLNNTNKTSDDDKLPFVITSSGANANTADTTKLKGGLGTLVQVFPEAGKGGQTDYRICVIETYVGTLKEWTDAVLDANGNVIRAAKAKVTPLNTNTDETKAYYVGSGASFTAADKGTVVIYTVADDVIQSIQAAPKKVVAPVAYSTNTANGTGYFKTADGAKYTFAFNAVGNDVIKTNATTLRIELLNELFAKLNLKDDLVTVYFDNYGNVVDVALWAPTAAGVDSVFVLKDAKAAKAADKDYYVEMSLIDQAGNPLTVKATATGDKFVTEAAAKAAALALKATQLNGLTVLQQMKPSDEYATYSFTLVGVLARVANLKSNAVNLIKGVEFNGQVPATLRGIANKLTTIGKPIEGGAFDVNYLLSNVGTDVAEQAAYINKVFNSFGASSDVLNAQAIDTLEMLAAYTAVAPHVDSKTVFIVEGENGYTTYTGVKNLPALTAKSVLGIGGQFVSFGLGKEVVLLKNAKAAEAPAPKAVDTDAYIYLLSDAFDLEGGKIGLNTKETNELGITEVGYDYVTYPAVVGGAKVELKVSHLLPVVKGTMVKAKAFDTKLGTLTAIYPALDGNALFVKLQPVQKTSTTTVYTESETDDKTINIVKDDGKLDTVTSIETTKSADYRPAIVNGVLYCEGMNFIVADDCKIVDKTGTAAAATSLAVKPAESAVWVVLNGAGEVVEIVIPGTALTTELNKVVDVWNAIAPTAWEIK